MILNALKNNLIKPMNDNQEVVFLVEKQKKNCSFRNVSNLR